MIALFPFRGPTSNREGYQEIAYPSNQQGKAWLRWGEKSFSFRLHTDEQNAKA
jgi:hypothetical protein